MKIRYTYSDTLNLHGDELKWYDVFAMSLAVGGLAFMYKDSGEDVFKSLPFTELLEWLVSLTGLMSSVLKPSADWAADFR